MRYLSAATVLALAAQANAQDLVAALQADPDLSTLLGAISAVPGLADQLDAAEGITIFAPVNAAFEAVDPASAAGQAIGNSDVDGIASVLSYHVVPATIPSSAITATVQFVPTLLTPENVIGGAAATLVTPAQNLGAQLNGSSVILRSGNLATSTVTQAVSPSAKLITCMSFYLEINTNCRILSLEEQQSTRLILFSPSQPTPPPPLLLQGLPAS